jgi:hypothetical protein
MNTGNTVTMLSLGLASNRECADNSLPDRQNTAGLSKTSFFLNTTDSLFEDRRDLCWGWLGVGSISTLSEGAIECSWRSDLRENISIVDHRERLKWKGKNSFEVY